MRTHKRLIDILRPSKDVYKRQVMNSPVMERSLGRMSDEEREAAEAEKTSEDYVDFNGERCV